MKRIAVIAIVLGLALLVVPSAMAQFVVNPSSVAYGRTYGEWSSAWQQWALSIPVAHHPLFDNDDCVRPQGLALTDRLAQEPVCCFIGQKGD